MRSSIFLEIKRSLRVLTGNLSYSIPAVCALALGIGANTAIYSIVQGILLRPLPYRDAGQLVQVVRHDGSSEFKVSASDFDALQHEQSIWDEIVLYQQWAVSFNGSAGPEMLRSANVSTNFFAPFGVRPAFGRTFYPDESQRGKESVAIVSDSIWRKRFAADPGILGKTFTFGAKPYTVVGIAAPDFSFPGADVWFPLVATDGLTNGDKEIVARLKGGTSLWEAQSAADVITARLARQEARGAKKRLQVVSLQGHLNRQVRPLAFSLFAISGLVLLLACANVSLALISRGIEKSGEIAVRQALGARARHLIQHVLTESVVVGLLGGALGAGIAWGGIRLFLGTAGQFHEGAGRIDLNLPALEFTLVISILAGILAGLIPAVVNSKKDIASRLAQLGSYFRPAVSKLRVRDFILAFQISAALLLLVCTSLMLRSLLALSAVDVGFDFRPALVVWTAPPQSYNQDQVKLFYQQVLEGVQGLPGVSAAGVTNNGFFFGIHTSSEIIPGTDPAAPSHWVEVRSVSPDLFRAAGMRLAQGRYFDDADAAVPSPGKVVIDDTFAQRFWAGESALGKMITIPGKPATEWQVIGVIKSTRDVSLIEEPAPTIYRDYRNNLPHSMCLVVRTARDPRGYARAVRDRILAVDSNTPPGPAIPLEDLQSEQIKALQIGSILLGGFAAIALALAAVGIYGAVAYAVVQRTHEIGVRISLGASRSNVLRLVMVHAVKVSIFGLGFGVLGAFLVTGVLSGMISYISRSDTLSYVIASLLLSATALAAAYVPARRAAQVDPVVCLRRE